MSSSKGLWLTAALVVASWASIMFQVPTFDLDESLYRRLAEEMKLSGEYFIPTWDGKPFYEKPPTYFWTILLASRLFDPRDAPVSIFASRLPSFLFTLMAVACLGVFWPRFLSSLAGRRPITTYPEWLRHPTLPFLVYSMALLPGIGASSVLLDPMLTAFFTPVLLVFSLLWLEGDGTHPRRPRRGEVIVLAVGMAGATAVKGLIGLILPALAVLLHSLSACDAWSPWRAGRILWRAIQGLMASFVGAILIAGGFYLLIHWKAGPRFDYEFFVVHHFGRGAVAMQGHGGSLWYHPGVLLLGGAALSTLLLLLFSKSVSLGRGTAFSGYARWGFPFSWTLAFLLFYSASSTKLPNYTWPVWPAMSLGVCVFLARLATMKSVGSPEPAPQGSLAGVLATAFRYLAYFGSMVVIAAFLLIGLTADQLAHRFLNSKAQVVLSSAGPWPGAVRVALILVGLCVAAQFYAVARIGSTPLSRNDAGGLFAACAVLAAISVGLLAAVVGPFVADVMVGPYARLADKASRMAGAETCLVTVGSRSPTVSLHFRRGRVNDCSGTPHRLIIGPTWKEGSCEENNLVVVARDRHLFLCGPKSPETRAPEKERAA